MGYDVSIRKPDGAKAEAVGNVDLHQLTSIGNPDGLEATRQGARYLLGNNAAVTGIAPVQALPTTAAQWVLWNNDTKLAAYLEELGMILTSGTPGVGGLLLACLFNAPTSVPAMTAGCAIFAAGAVGPAASKMLVKSGPVTVTDPAAPVWYPVAQNSSPNVTAFAGSTYFENRALQGSIAIPPKAGLGLAVVAPAGTTPLFAPFAKWVERLPG